MSLPNQQSLPERPRAHETEYDYPWLSRRNEPPSWMPHLPEYRDYALHRREDPIRRVEPMRRDDYAAFRVEQASLWDVYQDAVQAYIATLSADVRRSRRGEWALFNIEEPAYSYNYTHQQQVWREYLLQGRNEMDFLSRSAQRHRDQVRHNLYEFVVDDSQNGSQTLARSPAPSPSIHSSAAYPYNPPLLLTPSAVSAAGSSSGALYMRDVRGARATRPAATMRLQSESVPNLRRPEPQEDPNLKSSRTSPEKDFAPDAKGDDLQNQKQQPTRPRKDDDDGDHYAQKQKPRPRRKDDDDDQGSGGSGKSRTFWGSNSTSAAKMKAYAESRGQYDGSTCDRRRYGRYYPGHSRATKDLCSASSLKGSAAPFIPQNGRFEQILPREQLVRSVNWHKEEGKIPCGYSERAKFNQGGYRAGVIAV